MSQEETAWIQGVGRKAAQATVEGIGSSGFLFRVADGNGYVMSAERRVVDQSFLVFGNERFEAEYLAWGYYDGGLKGSPRELTLYHICCSYDLQALTLAETLPTPGTDLVIVEWHRGTDSRVPVAHFTEVIEISQQTSTWYGAPTPDMPISIVTGILELEKFRGSPVVNRSTLEVVGVVRVVDEEPDIISSKSILEGVWTGAPAGWTCSPTDMRDGLVGMRAKFNNGQAVGINLLWQYGFKLGPDSGNSATLLIKSDRTWKWEERTRSVTKRSGPLSEDIPLNMGPTEYNHVELIVGPDREAELTVNGVSMSLGFTYHAPRGPHHSAYGISSWQVEDLVFCGRRR